MADHAQFPVEVLTPEGQVFDGEVEMLATRTTTGEIGVLANHTPLLSILVPTELRLHRGGGELERFAQGGGYLQVANNRALVLVEDAVPPADLDVSLLQEKLRDAKARLAASEEMSAEYEVAVRDRNRAEVFLQIAQGTIR